MSDRYSISEAQDRFTQIIHDVENGEPVQIMRHGKSVAVVLSLEEYQRLVSEKRGFGENLAEFRQKYQVENLDINPDEVFKDVRDRSPGREVSF